MADKVTCPFNSVHVVERHKLIVHMGRCIKSYKGGSHTPMHCPLDYSHVVEAGKMNQHLLKCPQLALAAPLLSADFTGASDVVTGNLQLPQPPSCINQLVTAEWDTPENNGSSADAAAGSGAEYADALDDPSGTAGSVYSAAASDVTSSCMPASGGLGRGRGRGRGPADNNSAEDLVGSVGFYGPGDTVPGGYVLKHIAYPAGFGPRGRFEVRGSI